MDDFLATLGSEIEDADEETFNLFSLAPSLPNLGMIDAKAETLELSIADRDFGITQSTGLLQSSRRGGTTGAVAWQTSVKLAAWLASPKNALIKHGLLNPDSVVLELGSGISGLVPCVLGPMVKRVVATDQHYVLKLLKANIESNLARHDGKSKRLTRQQGIPGRRTRSTDVDVIALDWETDDIRSTLRSHGLNEGVDVIITCDCIINYSLVDPLVQACRDISSMRVSTGDPAKGSQSATVCIVAQQLRQPEVFAQWLHAFTRLFHVWRLPNEMLDSELSFAGGFVVHVGLLRSHCKLDQI